MIRVTAAISIHESELRFEFVRSSGPGGQNVNKVATAVQLRFDAARSPSLPEEVRQRLRRVAGRKLTAEGVLVITARRHRTQQKNRDDAVERFIALIRKAATAPKARRKTRPTRASHERRLAEKRRKGKAKGTRGAVRSDDE
jgi:ribosome-associated protein